MQRYNDLYFLPKILPKKLKFLNCIFTNLTSLPDVLPETLTDLNFSYNKVKTLPIDLPLNLKYLEFKYNNILSLPEKIPSNLNMLTCEENEYLHIPKNYAYKFRLIETPNYNQKANIIKRQWKSKKILKFMKSQTSHKLFDVKDLHQIIVFYL